MRGRKTTSTSRAAGNPLGCLAIALALTVSSAPALAQIEGVLEEITVTAQKREQTLADVPAAVSTIAGDTVRDYLGSAENIRALAGRVPSLQIESSNGRTLPRFYIRGLGNIDFDTNANQPVSMVFDEIPLENGVLRSVPLFDIARVEVLKGPQGSLFGRNTTAGVVKIDSVRPDFDTNGYIMGGLGSRETTTLEGAVGGGLTETLAARVSIKYVNREDWIDNIANGPGDDFGAFDETAARVQLLWQPGESFTGLFKAHAFSQDGTHPQVFYANAFEQGRKGLRPGFDIEQANHDGEASMSLDHYGFAANLQWEIGDNVTITSITGYDSVENFQSADVDGGLLSFDPNDIGRLGRQVFFNVTTGDGLDEHYQITQELRIAVEGERLFWQAGLFYFDEDYDVFSRDFEQNFSDIVTQQTESFAVFGQAEYRFTDALSVTLGLRYTDDDKNLAVTPGVGSPSPADTIAIDDSYGNWDLALNYNVNDDVSVYGRFANGSRGPVTLGRFGFTSSAETETANSFEVGFKSTLLDGRARWSSAAYFYEVDDQQLTATGGVANVNQLLNAESVEGLGVETEFEFLATENLRLIANISLNDTEIQDADLRDDLCGANPSCTGLDPVVGMRMGPFGPVTEVSIDGNPLPRTPEWLANAIVQYSMPLDSGAEIYFNTDWNYRSDSNIFLHRSVEFVAEQRWIGGLRVGFRDASGTLDFAFVGRNVTNEIVADGALNFLNLTAFVNEPRYWGAEVRYDFGN